MLFFIIQKLLKFLKILTGKNKKILFDKMHILQPKHLKLTEKEVEEFLKKVNVSKSQLPKILSTDAALPEGCNVGDIIKIERSSGAYFRVVV